MDPNVGITSEDLLSSFLKVGSTANFGLHHTVSEAEVRRIRQGN